MALRATDSKQLQIQTLLEVLHSWLTARVQSTLLLGVSFAVVLYHNVQVCIV